MIMVNKQDQLREETRKAIAVNHGIFTYKDLAEYLDITIHSFYNWLNGYYNLSNKKAMALQSFISDLL